MFWNWFRFPKSDWKVESPTYTYEKKTYYSPFDRKTKKEVREGLVDMKKSFDEAFAELEEMLKEEEEEKNDS